LPAVVKRLAEARRLRAQAETLRAFGRHRAAAVVDVRHVRAVDESAFVASHRLADGEGGVAKRAAIH
jgi:hypothetical protein